VHFIIFIFTLGDPVFLLLPLFVLIMGQPSLFLPSFSNFAKVFSPFFQRAICSFTESFEELEGQEGEPPMMVRQRLRFRKKSRCGRLVFALYPFLFLPFPFPYAFSYFITPLILQMLMWVLRNPSL